MGLQDCPQDYGTFPKMSSGNISLEDRSDTDSSQGGGIDGLLPAAHSLAYIASQVEPEVMKRWITAGYRTLIDDPKMYSNVTGHLKTYIGDRYASYVQSQNSGDI